MERCSYGFYTKRTEPVDSVQKKKDLEKEPQSPGYQLLSKPADKHNNDNQNINVAASQHVPAQQLLSPSHTSGPSHTSKDDSKDKTLLKVANSTTITLIENGTLNGDKDKDYPKNYFTLESKIDKKDDNKNSITITKTVPKQSPQSQADKNKGLAKSAKRPLQYLETLAEKAGITFEDKYEAANTLLALDKQNNINRRPPELKQPKTEPENHNSTDDYNRYRNQKEEDDKLQIQQQIIQQQQQQQHQQLQQLQQLQQQQLQQLQQQALQRQHQQVLQQHIKNQQDQQELLQKQFQHQQQQQQQQQQQKPELLQVTQSSDGQQKFLQPLHTQQFNVPGIGEINLSFLASPQNNVNLVFDKSQKSGMSAEIKPQQIVDGQTQVVQQQINMSQHDSSQQHHQTVNVVSSMPSSMAHQVQQQQAGGSIQQQAGQLPSMPPLHTLPQNSQQPQQLSSDWGHGRVQVIQQPLPNNAYLQQLYNTQGPLIMPGNIALHPGINSQQIQVIAAGKPFQGNQLAPHMLAQGKQVLQGQAAPFPGYTTIPTTQNQTFVFSPLSVINSQPSILPSHSQPTSSGIGQQKQGDMHKCGGKVTAGKVSNASSGGQTVQAQCVQVSQPVLGAQQPTQAQIISPLHAGGQPMQFAPWQISGALPQVWTGGLPAGTIPAGGLLAPNPTLFIRGNQADQPPSMFIQHSPQNNLQHNTSIACSTATNTKPRASADGMSKGPRPLSNILPSSGIRPASSVSTQTNQGQNQAKPRGKLGVRSPAPAAKQDAANQTNQMHKQLQQAKQQLLVMNPNGQMTQITSVQDKNALTKNMQQQALMQQQLQQQQQQQQLMHQQQQQTQQMVQHYQQQGIPMSMQQSGLPVGSMGGMPQTISMVQQIHPLSGMTQQGTIVGQLNTQSQNQITQVQAMQQQQQALVSGGMVQTSVGMGQQGMNHSAPMQTPSITIEGASVMAPILQVPTIPYNMAAHEVAGNTLSSPQLTLQGPAVGLIATPVQGSVLPMPQTLVAHVKSEEDKMPPPQPAVITHPSMPSLSEPEPAPVFSSATTTAVSTAITTTASAVTLDTASSTTSTKTSPPTKKSPHKATTAEIIASHLPPIASSAQHTPHSSQVVTTVASSTSVSSTITTSITAPVSSVHTYKGNQNSSRTVTQTASSEVKTVSQLPASELGTKGALDSIYYKGLPKAMVKPNILTHVIEGYVIQEAAEPFAVNRPLREWGTSNSASSTAAIAAAAVASANAATAAAAAAVAAAASSSSSASTASAEAEARDVRDARESRETRENRDPRDSRDKTRDSRDTQDKEVKRVPTSDEPPRKKPMLENKSASRISSSISSSRDEAQAGPSKSCRNQPPEPDHPEEQKLSVANKWSSKGRRSHHKEQQEPENQPKNTIADKNSSKSRRSQVKEPEQVEALAKTAVPDKSKTQQKPHKEPVQPEEPKPSASNKQSFKSKSCHDKPKEPEDSESETEEEEEKEDPNVSIADDWTVNDVYDFIRNIPGCGIYAEDFLMQEVDGEALLLIKPEHLVMALSMKLGPALKIVACIDALRPENEQNDND